MSADDHLDQTTANRMTSELDPAPGTVSDRDLVESLRAENAMLRETLDMIEGTIIVYDQERNFKFANQAYHLVFPHIPPNEELIGLKYEDLLRMSIAAKSVADPQAYIDPDAFIARRIVELNRREPVPTEATTLRPGRETYQADSGRWFLLRSRRAPSGNNITLRVDITEQKMLQQEALQARDIAEEANRMKSQFLANLSHELRTPLNAVINFAQLLLDEVHGPLGAPEYRSFANDIAEGGASLLALIDQLLDLARAEAGRLAIREIATDPAAVIREACAQVAREAEAASVDIRCDIRADLGRMQGDPHRLRQVLVYLIANAVKFSRGKGRIRIAASHDSDGSLRIIVRDNGIGITASNLPRVMQPFEQGAELTLDARPGVGLGLPLAHHLVQLHGGTLTLRSRYGRGTTVTILLPAWRMLPDSTAQPCEQPIQQS